MNPTALERLERLESRLAPAGCATCERWAFGFIAYGHETASGDVKWDVPERPEECPACGRHVPLTHRLRIIGQYQGEELPWPAR